MVRTTIDLRDAGVDPLSRRDFWRILYGLRGEGVAIVCERERHGGEGAVAMIAVGVVFSLSAEADLYVGDAAAALVRDGDGAELRGHNDTVGVGDGVTEEVGLRLLGSVGGGVAERVHGAVKLGLHGVDEQRCG